MFLLYLISWSLAQFTLTVYAASLCTFVGFESMIWPSIRFDISLQNFKSLQIYLLTTNRKKTIRRIFSYKFGCRKKTLSHFLASRSSPSKTVNTAPKMTQYRNTANPYAPLILWWCQQVLLPQNAYKCKLSHVLHNQVMILGSLI